MTAGSRLAAVAGHRPRRVVGNQELAGRLGVTASWIERRLGVRRRRFAGPGESVTDMAAAAATKALASAGEPATRVDLIIVATCSAPSPMPNVASQVATRLGVPALARLMDLGRVRSGEPVLLLGFGAGLSYAAQVIDCP